MLVIQPVAEPLQDRPGPRPPQGHDRVTGEFPLVDVLFDGVEGVSTAGRCTQWIMSGIRNDQAKFAVG